jgi:hydrogenase maturation protease
MGDDRLGWVAAATLRRAAVMNAAPSGLIEISILDRPGALLPMHWRGTDSVILLDAVRSGAAPGTRHCLDASHLTGAGMGFSSHGFGVAEAVELARALGEMPARLLLRGIEADPFWAGISLSPAVASVMSAFSADIAKEALELSNGCSPAIVHTARSGIFQH